MKKMISVVLALVLVMSMGAVSVSAAYGHTPSEVCTHPISSYIFSSASNGTHASICGECGKIMVNNIPCSYNAEGECFTCGYARPKCLHPISGYVFVSNNNGTHASVCGECGEVMFNNIPCDINPDTDECFTCGYSEVESAPSVPVVPVVPAKPAAPLGKLLVKLLGKLFR